MIENTSQNKIVFQINLLILYIKKIIIIKMNNIIFARLFILYLLFNIGGWIYFGFLQYYLNFITSNNCNYYYNELIANKILIGIIMSLVTLNTLNIISIYKNNEFNNINLYFDTFIYRSFLVSL